MGRGQAFGIDRKYQEYCRDFLIRTRPGLSPYVGDGCDVPFAVGGTPGPWMLRSETETVVWSSQSAAEGKTPQNRLRWHPLRIKLNSSEKI